ncbi:MAG: O-antigen ligase family protein, partial [Gammaproteobacteria bacterium]
IQADRTGSAQQRWSSSVAAVEYIVSHPLTGAGIGMNILALNRIRGAAWVEVHDVYLVYAMELGIPGLIMFLLLLRGAFKNAHRAKVLSANDPESADFHYLAEGIGVSLLAFAVAAFFYPDAYQFYFYYFAGLAAAAKHIATIPDGKIDAGPGISFTTGEPEPCRS